MDLRARIRLAICAADHEEHLTEDDEARIFDAVMPIVAELAADLDNAERDNRRLQAVIDRVRELHRPHDCTTDHVKTSTPVPCINDGVCRGCASDYPCRTANTLEQK